MTFTTLNYVLLSLAKSSPKRSTGTDLFHICSAQRMSLDIKNIVHDKIINNNIIFNNR